MPSRWEKSVRIGKHQSNALLADFGSNLAVIVTHPWGLLGGNMYNNVVAAVAMYFQRLEVTTVRFDFGGSQIGRGYTQVEQVKEVANELLSGRLTSEGSNKPQCVLLVGYSYGSLISGSASVDIPECIGSIQIAPPFSVQHWLLLFNGSYHMNRASQRASLPKLVAIGSNDNFTSEHVFNSTVESVYPVESTTGAVLKGADHFFDRRERDLMEVVGQWLSETYPSCNGDLRQLKNISVS